MGMTVYTIEFEIPANTLKSNPVAYELKIEEPVFDSIHLLIPPGVWALAGIRICYGIAQFFPYPP